MHKLRLSYLTFVDILFLVTQVIEKKKTLLLVLY